MKKLVIPTAIPLFALTSYANAACRTMHQVSDNMMELGYTDEWEGDTNRDVLGFVQAKRAAVLRDFSRGVLLCEINRTPN